MSKDFRLNILAFPGILAVPLENTPLTTNLFFLALPRRSGPTPGLLVDNVELGSFRVAWDVSTFHMTNYNYNYNSSLVYNSSRNTNSSSTLRKYKH